MRPATTNSKVQVRDYILMVQMVKIMLIETWYTHHKRVSAMAISSNLK